MRQQPDSRATTHGPLRLTRRQVREVDRLAFEKYALPTLLLMENAARAVAEAAWDMLGRRGGSVVIYCGGGNNGGDGFAAARHLSNRGARIGLRITADARKLRGDALTNFEIVRRMGLPMTPAEGGGRRADEVRPGLVIDALFGTGLTAAPREPAARFIEAMAAWEVPVLAVDIPSGLDCDTGEPLGAACVRATKTVTFVAEKAGFANPASKQYTGEVIVGDIGCPRELIDEVKQM